MAHYAFIDSTNTVVAVITGMDENIVQENSDGSFIGGSSEAWEEFYSSQELFQGLTCKRTSYNGNIRKQYAGIGYAYNPTADVFIAPQPFPSWTLDANFDWQAPIPRPIGKFWRWDEENLEWIEFDEFEALA